MRLSKVVTLGVVGAALSLAALLATENLGVGERADGSPLYSFVLEDLHDRGAYVLRGRWLPTGRTPYLEEHSEYPQLATWFMGLPYLFLDHGLDPGLTKLQVEAATKAVHGDYLEMWHVHMAVVLALLVLVVAAGLVSLGENPAWALLAFLPASLYFSFNRYDVLPALLVSAAVLFQLRGRILLAAFVMALAAMTKWYPALLLPLLASANVQAIRRDQRTSGATGPAGGWGTALLWGAVAPGLVATATAAAILAITWFWDGGGLDAILHPFQHHGDRPPNPSSLVRNLTDPRHWGLVGADSVLVTHVIPALQFLPALVLAFVPLRTRRALVAACVTVVISFVLFSKVFSPQWVIWFAPLLLLLVPRSRGALALLVSLELLLYLQTPLFFYEMMAAAAAREQVVFEPAANWMLVNTLRSVALLLLWAWALLATLRSAFGTGAAGGGDDISISALGDPPPA